MWNKDNRDRERRHMFCETEAGLIVTRGRPRPTRFSSGVLPGGESLTAYNFSSISKLLGKTSSWTTMSHGFVR